MGFPTFTWNGGTYPCTPSITDYSTPLETGGNRQDKILTMTVQLQDKQGNLTFPNGIRPQPNDWIVCQTFNFRIQTIKQHPTNAYMRIIATGVMRGQ